MRMEPHTHGHARMNDLVFDGAQRVEVLALAGVGEEVKQDVDEKGVPQGSGMGPGTVRRIAILGF